MSGAEKPDRMRAVRDLVRWANSDISARALDAIEVLELTEDDLDRIFARNGNVVKIPHLGRIS
jgi:hypothetical protein